MNRLQSFFLVALFLNCSFLAEAHEANIQKGNLLTSASIDFEQTLKNTNNTTYFNLDLAGQYFLVDHFALGANFDLAHLTDGNTTLLLGPSLRYFFWQSDRLGAYLGAAFGLGLTDTTIRGRLTGTIGIQYFITPAVAAGPWVSVRHVIRRYSSNYEMILMGANFAIYL